MSSDDDIKDQLYCHEKFVDEYRPWTASEFFKYFPVPKEMEPLLQHLYGDDAVVANQSHKQLPETANQSHKQSPETANQSHKQSPETANLSVPVETKETNEDKEEAHAICARRMIRKRPARRSRKRYVKQASYRSAMKSAIAQRKPRLGGAFVPSWFPLDCPFRYRKGYTQEYVERLLGINAVPAIIPDKRLMRRLSKIQ